MGREADGGRDSPAALEAAGRRAFPGFRLLAVHRVGSTQDVARAAARAGAATGFCCVAEEQSAGRGRQGRTWSAPAGSALLCSVLVHVHPDVAGGLPLAVGLAVRSALAGSCGVDARVKWPNDLLVGGRKLAGILCETEPLAPGDRLAVVVGIGINLRASASPSPAAAVSVEEMTGTAPPAGEVLASLLPELARWVQRLGAGGVTGLRAEWLEHATGIGGHVVARGPGGDVVGCAEGIDADGALLVRTPAGLRRVLAGDVHLSPPSADEEAEQASR